MKRVLQCIRTKYYKDYDANNSIMSSNIGQGKNDFLEVPVSFASKYHFQRINLDLECPKYTVSEMQGFYKIINSFQPHFILWLNY